MFKAKQYRAKAAEYKESFENPRSLGEAKEYRRLEQTYLALADNEEWLVNNADKVLHSSKKSFIGNSGPITTMMPS
jgi:hypothetical protein